MIITFSLLEFSFVTPIVHIFTPFCQRRLKTFRQKSCTSYKVEYCSCLFRCGSSSFPVRLGAICKLLTQLRWLRVTLDCLKRPKTASEPQSQGIVGAQSPQPTNNKRSHNYVRKPRKANVQQNSLSENSHF